MRDIKDEMLETLINMSGNISCWKRDDVEDRHNVALKNSYESYDTIVEEGLLCYMCESEMKCNKNVKSCFALVANIDSCF